MSLPVPSFAGFIQEPEAVGRPKSILLYGTHGTRKSSTCGSLALVEGFNKILYIDIDQGAEVLMSQPAIRAKVQDGTIQVLPISSLDPQAFVKINAVIDEITSKDFGYDAVILDTLDVAQDVAEKHFKAMHANSATSGKKDGFAIWGDLGVWTDEIVRRLHESPFFMGVITAHSKEQTLESGAHRILPRLSGSSKDAIGGIPSIVAYLEYQQHPETGETHLIANVAESDVVISKNRYNLPPMIADPTMPKLFEMIAKATAAEPDAKAEAVAELKAA